MLATRGACSGTLGERVNRHLRERLIGGELSPGEKLSLRAAAETLGVSMMPVRDAVSRLVAEDALEVMPNRAVRVPIMTLSRFRELTVVRIAIEGFAVELAAKNRTGADLADIRRADQAFRQQCRSKRPNLRAAVRADKDLHFAVYRASGLPTLRPIIEGMWLKIGPIINLDLRLSAQRLRSHNAERHYARLVAALAAHDADAARAALIADITRTARFIEEQNRLPA